MKTLIAYYSYTKNNEKLAKYLQKQLHCDLVKIETSGKRNGFSIFLDLILKRKPEIKPVPYYLDDYDHVIFIAPIWAGKIATPMMSYLNNEKLNIKQYSFVTLCGGGAGQKEKIHDQLIATLQRHPVKLLELWINDLLPPDKKDTIRYTSGFRIEPDGFGRFEDQLRTLLTEEDLAHAS